MTTVALIQARMNSTRLPGKVLMDLAGKPMLVRVAERVAAIRDLTAYAVLISRDPSDDPIVEACGRYHVPLVRGGISTDDVLSRYCEGAMALQADAVMRITADCPLLSTQVCEQVLRGFRSHEVEYAANIQPFTQWADGLDCEVFTTALLVLAHNKARLPYNREHVTPWMRNGWMARTHYVTSPVDMRGVKWSVDTEEDLARARWIYANLPSPAHSNWEDTLTADCLMSSGFKQERI